MESREERINKFFKAQIGDISGGKVLDIGTGRGGFINVLKENLKDYSDITGVDKDGDSLEKAREEHRDENIFFHVMDGEQLSFDDESFDTVSISCSFHHMPDIKKVLRETLRVLRPGGSCIIFEMYSDAMTEIELTSVYMHHLWSEIDRSLGKYHNKTLEREEILDYVQSMGLSGLECEFYHPHMETVTEEALEEIREKFREHLQKAESSKLYDKFNREAEDLYKRVLESGLQGEPMLLCTGKK